MFREVDRPERNEVDRITGTPWRSRWRGLRFGHPRVEGSLSSESEQLVLVMAPIVVGAGLPIAWIAESRSCVYWAVATLVLSTVAVAATWMPRRRRRSGAQLPPRGRGSRGAGAR